VSKLLEAEDICILHLPAFLQRVNKRAAYLALNNTWSQSAISTFTFPIRLMRSPRVETACAGCNEAWVMVNGNPRGKGYLSGAKLTSIAGYSWRESASILNARNDKLITYANNLLA
jgi:hypothetical protein